MRPVIIVGNIFSDILDFFNAIWDWLVDFFTGVFFINLWNEHMWPFILYVFEMFFLSMLILPLTLVSFVGEVVDVFSGVKPITAAYETSVTTLGERFDTTGSPSLTMYARYYEDLYFAHGTNRIPVTMVPIYDQFSTYWGMGPDITIDDLIGLMEEAEELGYADPNYLKNALAEARTQISRGNASQAAEATAFIRGFTNRVPVHRTETTSPMYLDTEGGDIFNHDYKYNKAPKYEYFTQSSNPHTFPHPSGQDFFMSFMYGGGQLWLITLHSHRDIWRDYIQHNDSIVANPSRAYTDSARYTPLAQRVMSSRGVQPGSEAMYAAFVEEMSDLYNYGTYGRDRPTVTTQTTLLEYFMTQSSITRVFWGVVLIGIALCLGFSIVAVIRSMGDLQQNRPISRVLASVGKAMLTFLLVPFLCLAAVAMSTVVMRQINVLFDTANEYGEEVSVEGALFLSAVSPEHMHVYHTYYIDPFDLGIIGHTMSRFYGDEAGMIPVTKKDPNPSIYDQNREFNKFREDLLFGRRGVGFSDISRLQRDLDVWGMMFSGPMFFTWIASWFAVIILLMIVVIFLRRIFEVIMLYLVSPFFVATIPLDDGKRFGSWRDMFVSRLVAGFGSIFTLKMFLLMLPLIWSPNLEFSDSAFLDSFFKMLLMMGGLYSVYKSHTLISTIINPQGAAAEQESAGLAAAGVGMAVGATMAVAGGAGNLALGAGTGLLRSPGGDAGSGGNTSGGGASGGSGNKNPAL